MKFQEIQKMSADELKTFVLKQKEELFKLRFQKANGNLPNSSLIKKKRRDVARAKTSQAQNRQQNEN